MSASFHTLNLAGVAVIRTPMLSMTDRTNVLRGVGNIAKYPALQHLLFHRVTLPLWRRAVTVDRVAGDVVADVL